MVFARAPGRWTVAGIFLLVLAAVVLVDLGALFAGRLGIPDLGARWAASGATALLLALHLAALSFGWRKKVLDRGAGEVRVRWSFLGPLGEKVYLARDCKAVFILGRPNRYHPSAGHYRVVLSGAGEGGPFAVELTSSPDARQAREEAKGAAAFLGLPVLEPDTDPSRAS